MLEPNKYIQNNLKTLLSNGKLKSLKLFQVNDSFFEFPERKQWIIDGGIELSLSNGTFCIGWTSETDLFVFEKKPFKEIYGQENFVQLENENIKMLNSLIGLRISDVKFKTLDFEYVADYTMRIEKEKRFVEIILSFENSSTLQLSLISYNLEPNSAPTDYFFDISTSIMISLNRIVEIESGG